jgi:hypothetical protein
MADGTVGSPGMFFGAATNTGFSRASNGAGGSIFRASVDGLQALAMDIFDGGGGPNTGTRYRISRDGQTINSGLSTEAYLASFVLGTNTIIGDTPGVLTNFGLSDLIVDPGTKSFRTWSIELDKMVVGVSSGTATYTQSIGNTRVRVPWGTTGVTVANAIGIGFSPPNAVDVTGTMTQGTMMHLPSVVAPAVQPTNGWIGILAEDGYTQHLASNSGIDLKFRAGSNVVTWEGLSGTLTHKVAGSPLNIGQNYATKGTGIHLFYVNGATSGGTDLVLRLSANVGSVNGANISPGLTGAPATFGVTGEANAGVALQAAGTGPIFLKSNGTKADFGNTNSAAWTFAALSIFPAAATGAASIRLPHGTAPTSPVNGDMWTTTAGLFVRINGVTVGPLS